MDSKGGPKIGCRKCGDIIQSKHRHDMVWCKCGAVAIDGGSDYTKVCGDLKNLIEHVSELVSGVEIDLEEGIDDEEEY